MTVRAIFSPAPPEALGTRSRSDIGFTGTRACQQVNPSRLGQTGDPAGRGLHQVRERRGQLHEAREGVFGRIEVQLGDRLILGCGALSPGPLARTAPSPLDKKPACVLLQPLREGERVPVMAAGRELLAGRLKYERLFDQCWLADLVDPDKHRSAVKSSQKAGPPGALKPGALRSQLV